MFEVDPERSWVDPSLGSISSLIQSLNTPLVAAGQHPAENVQSWILTRTGSAGAVEVFVYFHLTESNQAVLYRWDGGPVPGANQEQVVEEAMGFCESMGFMMDNLNFGQLPPDKRGELLQTLPPFVKDLATLSSGKDVDEIPLSMSKKVVDPVEEFAKARAAAAGQPTANDFADPGGGVDSFDPMSLMEDIGGGGIDTSSRVNVAGDTESDLQIEITEIDGLELMPAADGGNPRGAAPSAPPRMESSVRDIEFDDDEPPLVVGSASMTPAPGISAPARAPAVAAPVATVAPVAPAPSAVKPMPVAAPELPTVRGRERTPAGEVTLFDDASSAPPTAPAPPPLAVAPAVAPSKPAVTVPARPAAPAPKDDEFNVDDLLGDLDVGSSKGNGAAEKPAPAPAESASSNDIDVSSALDDILDGVESSKPPAKPAAPAPVATPAPAPMAAAPAKPKEKEEISLDLDLDGLDSLGGSMEASISSPDEALVALEALGVGGGDDPFGIPSLDEPSKPPPAASASAPPPVRPAVEEAWASEATQAKTNGNGRSNGSAAPAPLKLDISTDDLARLLSML